MAEQVMSMPLDRAAQTLSAHKRAVRTGWAVILFVFGGLFFWSVLAPFEGAVLTGGQVVVESNQQAVQHLEGGIVREIYVREADKVVAGQKLISLDPTTADATIDAQEARLFDLLGTEARLIAERDNKTTLSLRPAFADLADDPDMIAVMDSQQSLLTARTQTRATQLKILQQRIDQLNTRINGMGREIESKDVQIFLLEDEVSRFEKLTAQGNASEVRVLSLKRDLSRLKGERDALTSDIAATQVQIGETRSEVLRVDQDARESILSDLREAQTKIGELSEQRLAALDRRSRLDILAPSNGRVIGIRAHTVGGIINPSEPIMYVVPEDDRLVAKLRVKPSDIDKIGVGQIASLRFSAFDRDATPLYEGKVLKVSADALIDQVTGVPYFEVIASIPDEALASEAFQILPGMPVDASLQTTRRTILSYLIKPLADSVSHTFRE
jgi:HlyD family type I secretion membrane fusion protein